MVDGGENNSWVGNIFQTLEDLYTEVDTAVWQEMKEVENHLQKISANVVNFCLEMVNDGPLQTSDGIVEEEVADNSIVSDASKNCTDDDHQENETRKETDTDKDQRGEDVLVPDASEMDTNEDHSEEDAEEETDHDADLMVSDASVTDTDEDHSEDDTKEATDSDEDESEEDTDEETDSEEDESEGDKEEETDSDEDESEEDTEEESNSDIEIPLSKALDKNTNDETADVLGIKTNEDVEVMLSELILSDILCYLNIRKGCNEDTEDTQEEALSAIHCLVSDFSKVGNQERRKKVLLEFRKLFCSPFVEPTEGVHSDSSLKLNVYRGVWKKLKLMVEENLVNDTLDAAVAKEGLSIEVTPSNALKESPDDSIAESISDNGVSKVEKETIESFQDMKLDESCNMIDTTQYETKGEEQLQQEELRREEGKMKTIKLLGETPVKQGDEFCDPESDWVIV